MNSNAATMNDPRASVTGTSPLVNIDKNIYYKDVALIRYNPDEQGESLVQVVNEIGFMNTFQRRANEPYWKTVSSI